MARATPNPVDKPTIQQARDGEHKIVIQQELDPEPHEKNTGQWVEENRECGRRVVKHARKIARLLRDREVRSPELPVN